MLIPHPAAADAGTATEESHRTALALLHRTEEALVSLASRVEVLDRFDRFAQHIRSSFECEETVPTRETPATRRNHRADHANLALRLETVRDSLSADPTDRGLRRLLEFEDGLFRHFSTFSHVHRARPVGPDIPGEPSGGAAAAAHPEVDSTALVEVN